MEKNHYAWRQQSIDILTIENVPPQDLLIWCYLPLNSHINIILHNRFLTLLDQAFHS